MYIELKVRFTRIRNPEMLSRVLCKTFSSQAKAVPVPGDWHSIPLRFSEGCCFPIYPLLFLFSVLVLGWGSGKRRTRGRKERKQRWKRRGRRRGGFWSTGGVCSSRTPSLARALPPSGPDSLSFSFSLPHTLLSHFLSLTLSLEVCLDCG